MAATPIDVWDAKTFDLALSEQLAASAELVRSYMLTDHQIFLDHELGRARNLLRPTNPYGSAYIDFVEKVGRGMASRTIRAWHYTRLTDVEVDIIRGDGLHLSTKETLRARLAALVAVGTFTAEVAEALFAASPFHSEQFGARSSKFWMTSHPTPVDDGGIEPLLGKWGGESASFWLKDPAVLALVAQIGAPRILEVIVPLDATRHAHSAGEAVVATFGRTLGCIPEKRAFDLYSTRALSGEAVGAIHSEGDTVFSAVGQGYPSGFIDVALGRWEELTGERSDDDRGEARA